MWKYVSRRLKDTIERGAGFFDVRSAASAGAARGDPPERLSPAVPAKWRSERRCCENRHYKDGPNRNWYFNYLNQSWLGAITWSSALALGWYATQLIHLKKKYPKKERSALCSIIQRNLASSPLFCGSTPKSVGNNKVAPQTDTLLETLDGGEKNTGSILQVHLVTNDHSIPASSTGSSTGSSSSNDLSDILNSIENKLGLAAIENGQHQDGLSMLRSAADRRHPPALYNLGLCYELGLGVKPDEKMAMDLYRVAATLEHPGAMYNLAVYYGQGRGGLARDQDTAARLLRLAALKGQADAVDALKTLQPERDSRTQEEDWALKYELGEVDLMPSQTSLFVEQINSLHTEELRCKTAAC